MIVLFHEIQEGMSDARVVKDELMVEISKIKEGSHIFDFGGGQPGSDAIKFYRVYGKLIQFDDHPKVFHFKDVKLALLKL